MNISVFCIVLLFGVGNSWASLETEASHHWDILIFTQHWPNTVCIQWKEKVENHTCILSQEWAVHGVWPTKLGTIGPGFCNNTWHFNPQELKPIQEQLDTHWPNIENGTQEDSLWKHEWQKHGTCAAQLPSLDSELKYFSQGLAWIALNDMTAILNKAGIYPSATKTYSAQEISDAVKRTLQKDPGIECLHDPRSGNTYLFEIRICFDKQLELVDCDGIKGSLTAEYGSLISNCPAGATIMYPSSVPGAMDPRENRPGWSWTSFLEFVLFLQWITF